MSIEALKEQARRHEQKEEWRKALDQYRKAIERLAQEEQPDIGLYNRVGDLYVRIGELDSAVEHYEQAADLYMEAFLPNNAIAVCKKIIRNVPDRHAAYLRMGQIRAEQNFLPDARSNFLTYAERMQQAGDLDESFRALIEFCDLAPDDVDVRIVVAEQMGSHGRAEEAVQQLSIAYRHLMVNGDSGRAADVGAKIHNLDPNASLDAASAAPAADSEFELGSSIEDDDAEPTFGEIEYAAAGPVKEVPAAEGVDAGESLPDFQIGGDESDEDDADAVEIPIMAIDHHDDVVELPIMEIDDDDVVELPIMEIDDDDVVELPIMEIDDDDVVELPIMEIDDDDVVELPTMEIDHGYDLTDDEEADAAFGVATFELGASADDENADAEDAREGALEEAASDSSADEAAEEAFAAAAPADEVLTLADARAMIDTSPDDVGLRQRVVELAYASGDDSVVAEAFLGLAQALDRTGETARAQVAFQQVLQVEPENEEARAALGKAATSQPVREVAANEEYIDLGSMIFGDEEEKTTRFVVAYEEPSGDEQADFAKMLSQFKQKVSQNLDADDVKAHHDLGTAYKEMGLLDEAVSEFQAALRANSDHLPTYELMGQTFLEMGRPDAAVRSLQRALEVEYDIEEDLVGIYYYLARAHEEVGSRESAVEFYDRVFALDINFADVTERLRALR